MVDQNRMDQLNALAGGGSAGLDAFKNAQSQTQDARSAALSSMSTSTDGFNWAQNAGGVGVPGASHALDSYINKGTQGAADVASQGVSDATAQQGYNASALDSYIAQSQAKLNAANQQFEGNLDMKRQQDALSMRQSTDAFTAAQQKFANEQANPLSALTPDQQKAYVEGAGRIAQQAAVAKMAADQANINNSPATQANPNLGGRQQDAARTQLAGQQQTTANNERQAEVDLPQFQREAAMKAGWSPEQAMGTFPTDPASLTANASALDGYLNYNQSSRNKQMSSDLTAAKEQRDSVYGQLSDMGGINPDSIKSIQKGFRLNNNDTAALFQGNAWGDAYNKAQAGLATSNPSDLYNASGAPDGAGKYNALQLFRGYVDNQPWSDTEKAAIKGYWTNEFTKQGFSR